MGQQNLGLSEARKHARQALVGGVDEVDVLQKGTPEQVILRARAAVEASGGCHHLLTPGCATRMDVPPENLRALRKAAERV